MMPLPSNRLSPKLVFFSTTKKVPRIFHADEDLICHTSELFRGMLQQNRKPVEGDCCICTEELDPNDNHLVFCHDGCGQNFHQKCQEEWADARLSRGAPPKCAFCRADWSEGRKKPFRLLGPPDHTAVDMYVHWLYTRDIHIPAHYAWASYELNAALMDAMKVSSVLNDFDIATAATAKYLERFKPDEAAFSAPFLRTLCIKRHMDYFEEFVVDLCMLGPTDAYECIEFGYRYEEEQHCGRFYRLLSRAAMRKLGQAKPDLKWLVRKDTRNKYKIMYEGVNSQAATTEHEQGDRTPMRVENEQAQTHAYGNRALTVYTFPPALVVDNVD